MSIERMRTRVQSWSNNSAVYETECLSEGKAATAEYHRGAKEAYRRVLEEILGPVCEEKPIVSFVEGKAIYDRGWNDGIDHLSKTLQTAISWKLR